MQAEITFSENTIGTKVADRTKIFQTINPIKGLQQFIEEGDWDERLLGYEKYINRFSWAIIIGSVIYLVSICISILIR
jgi:hypothetical protein